MAIHGSLSFVSLVNNRESERDYTFSDLFLMDGKDNPLIEFDEYSGLSVTSTFDSDVEIVVEYPDSELVHIKPNKRYEISRINASCYVPGLYTVTVLHKGRRMSFFFKVFPSAMTSEALKDLRKAIDSFQEGLARDLFTRKISDDFAKFDPTIRNEYDVYHQIITNERHLFSLLDKINQDPIINLQKNYVIGTNQKRSDRKTEQWMVTKGKIKNDQFNSETFFLNKKIIQDKNSSENKLLKISLEGFRNTISDILVLFESKITFFSTRKDEISEDILFTKEMITKTNVDSEINALRSEIERRTREIQDLEQKANTIREYKKKLLATLRSVDQYLYQSWFKDIKTTSYMGLNKTALMNFNYKRSINLMSVKSLSKSSDGAQRVNELQFRNTAYLFEVYNLLIIHTALLELGYVPQDSELFTRNYGFIDAIVESTMVYLNGKTRIEVRYDKQIKRKHNHKKSDFYNLNAYSNKPDILIAKWDIETNKLLDAFIVEVKCVKRHYLISSFEHTKLDDQFRDYLSLCYLDKTQPTFVLLRGIIRKVIVAYPDADEEAYDLVFKMIDYIGVNPSVPVKQSRIYEELVEELS